MQEGWCHFSSNTKQRTEITATQEREETYAEGLSAVNQNQLLPRSGTVIVRTSATLARLMLVQKVSSAAWFRLGAIFPSNLSTVLQ